jgi:hypothetical protein
MTSTTGTTGSGTTSGIYSDPGITGIIGVGVYGFYHYSVIEY